jgi:hypothetical protein
VLFSFFAATAIVANSNISLSYVSMPTSTRARLTVAGTRELDLRTAEALMVVVDSRKSALVRGNLKARDRRLQTNHAHKQQHALTIYDCNTATSQQSINRQTNAHSLRNARACERGGIREACGALSRSPLGLLPLRKRFSNLTDDHNGIKKQWATSSSNSFIPICTQHAAAVKSQDRDDDRGALAAREEQCSNAFGL